MSFYSSSRTNKKSTDSTTHFVKRVRERYGISLTPQEVKKIKDAIQLKPSEGVTVIYIDKQTTYRRLYAITIQGKTIYGVWNKSIHALSTALTEQQAMSRSWKQWTE